MIWAIFGLYCMAKSLESSVYHIISGAVAVATSKVLQRLQTLRTLKINVCIQSLVGSSGFLPVCNVWELERNGKSGYGAVADFTTDTGRPFLSLTA